MRREAFGSTDRQVAVIGQGTWYLEQAPRAAAVAALRRGLDLGMTHIDTAEMYGSGRAEAVVGEAIAGRRDEVFLVSKVLPHNASRRGTRAACEASLRRLGTDRLDCYLLHWPGSHPLEETVAAFEELERDGKILSWGVSNFDVGDLEELLSVAAAQPPGLQSGALSSGGTRHRARGASLVRRARRRRRGLQPLRARPLSRAEHARRRRACARSPRRTARPPRQVALAFLTRRPSLFTIPKSASADHTEENAGAGELRLSEAEIARIDSAFPLPRRPSSLPML